MYGAFPNKYKKHLSWHEVKLDKIEKKKHALILLNMSKVHFFCKHQSKEDNQLCQSVNRWKTVEFELTEIDFVNLK